MSCYKLGNLVGKGGDGEVYDLIDEENVRKKVVKFIQPSLGGIRNYLEPYILLHFKHSHIMSAENIEIEDGLVKIIQSKADIDLNCKLRDKKINISKKLKYMRQLTEAVYYLHSHRIIHGDIKPHNILLFKDDIKLTDFSLSRIILKEPTICVQKPYTISYRAPEIRDNQIYIKSDIWALGCTLYEIFYGTRYFNLSKDMKAYHLNTEKNNQFDQLIINMLEINVNKRLGIEDILKFFNIEKININCYLEPKQIFEDNNIKSKYLQKCYYDEKNNKMSNKYKKIEEKIAKVNLFDLYEIKNII